jgi:PAS domain S-box-containing protein
LERAKAAEPLGYLVKPFDLKELQTTVKSALHHFRTSNMGTQEVLHQAEEKSRAMFENLPVGIYRTTPEGRILDANTALIQMLGYPDRQSLLTANIHDIFVQPEDRQRWQAMFEREKTVRDFKTQLRRYDGTTILVLDNARGIRAADGRIQYYEGSLLDITERELAEEALRKSEERLRELFDNAPTGYHEIDTEGRITKVNCTELEILGYTAEEMLGQPVWKFVTEQEASRQAVLAKLAGALPPGKQLVRAYRRKDETSVPVLIEDRLLRDAQGRITGIRSSLQDITDRKYMEDALRESEARLTCVINAAQDGILMMDDQGLITLWNPAAERITGYTAAEVVWKNLFNLIVPERVRVGHNSAFLSWWETGWNYAGTKMSEMPCVRKDGTEISIELSLSSVELHGRRTAVGVIRDITEGRRAQKERDLMEVMLRQAQKLESVGQLAAGIAHELNTPTQYVGDNTRFFKDAFGELQRALQAYARLLSACKKGSATPELVEEVEAEVRAADLEYISEEIPKAIGQTLEGIDRVATIVRAMKEFSHPGTKERTPTNTHKAIESTLIVCRNEYKYVAEVATDFDPSMPLVPCIPGDFNQVILNLIINAAHAIADKLGPASQSKGRITIKTIRDGNWAEIRVSDTGTGIPEAARSRIFDPFFTTKEVGKGTGQGLAICHAVLVGKHGGKITFETEVGKGTTFIVRLPLD